MTSIGPYEVSIVRALIKGQLEKLRPAQPGYNVRPQRPQNFVPEA